MYEFIPFSLQLQTEYQSELGFPVSVGDQSKMWTTLMTNWSSVYAVWSAGEPFIESKPCLIPCLIPHWNWYATSCSGTHFPLAHWKGYWESGCIMQVNAYLSKIQLMHGPFCKRCIRHPLIWRDDNLSSEKISVWGLWSSVHDWDPH